MAPRSKRARSSIESLGQYAQKRVKLGHRMLIAEVLMDYGLRGLRRSTAVTESFQKASWLTLTRQDSECRGCPLTPVATVMVQVYSSNEQVYFEAVEYCTVSYGLPKTYPGLSGSNEDVTVTSRDRH